MTDRARLEPSPVAPEQTAALIRGRRSVDQFTDEQPDDVVVREAIELARWAPNHHLTEPWRFYLLGPQSRAAVVDLNTRLVADKKGEEVAAAKRQRWQAVPGFLAVNATIEADPVIAREDYAACACAIQNLSLYLHSAGLACKWTSGEVTRQADFLRILSADPEHEYCVGLVWYGYPKRRPRSQRTAMDAILTQCP